jgi:hypothetical protein
MRSRASGLLDVTAPSRLSESCSKKPAPVADHRADDEPRPGHIRKPISWSTFAIAVLVAVSAALVWRRDGAHGVYGEDGLSRRFGIGHR